MNKQCFCGSQLRFIDCCESFINFERYPVTAEQLMRSRYSAFCHNRADYLLATHLPINQTSLASIQQTIDTTDWLGLKILKTVKGQNTDSSGEVEFVAFYKEREIQQLHEDSKFIKQNDHWFYVGGEQLNPIKLARNQLCFCDSGKKYKKCHGTQGK